MQPGMLLIPSLHGSCSFLPQLCPEAAASHQNSNIKACREGSFSAFHCSVWLLPTTPFASLRARLMASVPVAQFLPCCCMWYWTESKTNPLPVVSCGSGCM